MDQNDTFQPPPPPPPAPPPSTGTPQRPADYYEPAPQEPTPSKKGCSNKWVIGCGGAGCLVLLLIVIFFAWLATAGMPRLVGFLLNQVETVAKDQALAEATPELRAEFENELETLKENLRNDQVDMQQLQPLIFQIQEAMGDRKVTIDELEALTDAMRRINGGTNPEVSF